VTRLLRIAFFTERMLRGFGVDLAVHRLASGLAHRGHSVTVWAVFADEPAPSASLPYTLRRFPVGTTVFLPWYDRTVLRRLRQIQDTAEADVFVVTHPMGAALRALSPSIFLEFGVAPRAGLGLRERLNELYARSLHYRLFISAADSILAPSRFLRDSLPPHLAARTREFRLGVDHYAEPGPEAVSAFRSTLPRDKPISLYIGRLTHRRQPYKGVRTLLEVYRAVREHTHLVLAGIGTENDCRLAERYHATAVHSAPHELMPAIYAAADIFVTATRWEGVNLPLLEALHFGKPVLAFSIPVHREWVRSGVNGILAADPAEFVTHWKALAANEAVRAQVAERAAPSVAQFRWVDAVAVLETAALELRHSRPSGRR
jgi:glycosyltransferase involved in cell wall biosynthesis